MEDIKLKSFQSQINPHFIFNTLNAIQYYISLNEKTNAIKQLSLFGKLIRYQLNNLEKETVLLAEEIEMLNWYFKLQNLRYNNRFEFNVFTKSTHPEINTTIPSLFLHTVFENLIETAVLLKSDSILINTLFEIDSKFIKIKIILKPKILQGDSKDYFPDYRNNLLKWEEQIEHLNKAKKYFIKKKIIYFKDKNNNFKGYKIVIVLPNLS